MINTCVIGLGCRGYSMLCDVLLNIPELNVISVCDIYEDRVRQGIDAVKAAGQQAEGFTDYRDALSVPGLKAVFIFTGWSSHTDIAVHAMRRGIAAACEVGWRSSWKGHRAIPAAFTSSPYRSAMSRQVMLSFSD